MFGKWHLLRLNSAWVLNLKIWSSYIKPLRVLQFMNQLKCLSEGDVLNLLFIFCRRHKILVFDIHSTYGYSDIGAWYTETIEEAENNYMYHQIVHVTQYTASLWQNTYIQPLYGNTYIIHSLFMAIDIKHSLVMAIYITHNLFIVMYTWSYTTSLWRCISYTASLWRCIKDICT